MGKFGKRREDKGEWKRLCLLAQKRADKAMPCLLAKTKEKYLHFMRQKIIRGGRGRGAVMGKHPDLMVAHPTSTIFPTIGRNFEIS